MADTVLETFDALRENGTLIRLRIPDRDYERIVIVDDIRDSTAIPLIEIDCPAELADILASREENPLLHFEFTGEDQLHYRFTTRDVFVQGDAVLIPLPTKLDRIQRRNDFRLSAPLGALFYFTAGDQRKRVKMLDISISGASGILISIKTGTPQAPPVAVGQTILNLKLVFTIDSRETLIPVRECTVRQVQSLSRKGRYRLAVTFTRMDPEHRSRLRQFLYDEQRHMLKIRQQR